jgi:imidazole glycerol-phosphate synthase subunit HisH
MESVVSLKKVCILDYGAGNTQSVYNLFSSINATVKISNKEADIIEATHLVLSGVGAFGTAIKKIKDNLPMSLVTDLVFEQKKPFLGICVGMQILATTGTEFGSFDGLNWIPGIVVQLDTGRLPLPHIGWNDIVSKQVDDKLLSGLEKHNDFYFVHKYVYVPEFAAHVVATTEYGDIFPSIIRHQNICGVQFHPEKSQQAGKKLALNYLALS